MVVNLELTRNCIANNQREITKKKSNAELWFLCMTHRLIVRKGKNNMSPDPCRGDIIIVIIAFKHKYIVSHPQYLSLMTVVSRQFEGNV